MCALMVALWTAGARADGKVTSVKFNLAPTEVSSTSVGEFYNAAISGVKSGQLAGEKLSLMSYKPRTSRSGPDYRFSLSLTGNKIISVGDTFVVGTDVPSASITISSLRPTYRVFCGKR